VSPALLVGRLALATLFLVAGAGKLADSAATRRAVSDFGVPRWLARPFAVLLPIAELTVSVALLPAGTARWGALGALVLLIAFTVAVGFAVARGNSPECACFGQIHSSPASWRTLVRNAALAALAGVVAVAGWNGAGPSAVAWIAHPSAATAGLAGAVLLVGVIALQAKFWMDLLRQNGRLMIRLEAVEARLGIETTGGASAISPRNPAGLPVGQRAPGFLLDNGAGSEVSLHELLGRGRPVALVFSSPGCGPCNALLPALAALQAEAELTTVVVSSGTAEINRAKQDEHGLLDVLCDPERTVARAFHADTTPSAILLARDGSVASPLARGADAVLALLGGDSPQPEVLGLSERLARLAEVAGVESAVQRSHAVGDILPALALTELDGSPAQLSDHLGEQTVLLFWNTGCGFCSRMLADLQAWEAQAPSGAPRLMLLAAGAREANDSLGLRASVLLDPDAQAMRLLGGPGTPSAVLVDGDGRLGSQIVVGPSQVLQLLGSQQAQGVR